MRQRAACRNESAWQRHPLCVPRTGGAFVVGASKAVEHQPDVLTDGPGERDDQFR